MDAAGGSYPRGAGSSRIAAMGQLMQGKAEWSGVLCVTLQSALRASAAQSLRHQSRSATGSAGQPREG